MSEPRIAIAFDLYGTLLATESMATHLGKICGDEKKAQEVSTVWRRYQLEYSWRINAMGIYRSFREITEAALQQAADEAKLTLRPEHIVELMRDYDALNLFPEVQFALDALEAVQDRVDCYIFSNGPGPMIHASVANSPTLGKYAKLFKGEISVEEVQAFKPDARVYDHLVRETGHDGHEEEVWLVSANAWDVVGARARGLQAAFVDRKGVGWIDRLGDVIGGIKPSVIASGVDRAVIEIMNHSGGHY
ncbi:hypothetical protein RB595_007731 [Gaeumannomyces hyphopodioides]